MDNLTHSLAGLIEAELVSETFKATPEQRILLLAIGVLANNFPDLDLIYADRIERPLGYLLHHRGHTHTLGGIGLGFLLVIAILYALPKTRRIVKQATMLARVGLTLGLGLVTHLLMDSWNSYGVHPFWPFSSKWYFGDAVFILEPILWISFALPLLFLIHRKWFRYLVALPIVGVPLLAWTQDLLTWYSVLLLVLWGGVLFALLKRFSNRQTRLYLGVSAAILFVLIQFVSSYVVFQRSVDAYSLQAQPGSKLLEVMTDPSASNPFCWRVTTIAANYLSGDYKVDMKPVSLLPDLIDSEQCPFIRQTRYTQVASILDFRSTSDDDCYFNTWLQFSRIPVLQNTDAYDLRFGAPGEPANFSVLHGVDVRKGCPDFYAHWDRPRQDLLDTLRP